MEKPEIEFTPVTDVGWTMVDVRCPELTERVLASDESSEVATRILRFEPGTNTSALGTMVHPFWEEVYILEGSLHDLVLDQTFRAGSYACRPPGMRHGPWTSKDGCVTFEVRYPNP